MFNLTFFGKVSSSDEWSMEHFEHDSSFMCDLFSIINDVFWLWYLECGIFFLVASDNILDANKFLCDLF